MTKKSASEVQGKYYIGLMSGTSADGIDLALVDYANEGNDADAKPQLIASYYQSYSKAMTEKITALYQPGNNEIDRAFHLDIELAMLFSQAITSLLNQEHLKPVDIIAIGNHGQTIRHRPNNAFPFTLQIGCCQTLATLTGIRVVGQFRRKDMALGGQGAPLVPIFHQQLFPQAEKANIIVNIGGIANITFLPELGSTELISGFDTGPGNALLDDWYNKHHSGSNVNFDDDGVWAAKGVVNQVLLAQLMCDEFIKDSAPKSTGREYFHLNWLEQQLSIFKENPAASTLSVEDIQATLLAFTAKSISDEICALTSKGKVYVCGGGARNSTLINALTHELNSLGHAFDVDTISALGIDSDSLEAMAFSWLAYAFDRKLDSNMPAVTGASKSCTLGSVFLP